MKKINFISMAKNFSIVCAILIIPFIFITLHHKWRMKKEIVTEKNIDLINNYVTFQNAKKEKIGQIYVDESTLMIYGFVNRNIEIGAGNNVIINSGGGNIELKNGNKVKIKISEDRIDINTDSLYINGKKYE